MKACRINRTPPNSAPQSGKHVRTLAAAAVALLAATVASAEINLPPALMRGGSITVAELRDHLDATFDAIAGQGIRSIAKPRFIQLEISKTVVPETPNRQLLERLFPLLDANEDGVLTRAEFKKQINRKLTFADEDGDGKITLQELANAKKNMGVGDALSMIF
jgi:Ca2+-binding EF-hand superfamily protein